MAMTPRAQVEANVVEREIRIAAQPEVVFNYFIDPEKMIQWKGVEATLDPRPGGMYRVNVTGREVARGEYREIVPYSRIVISWGWEGEGHPIPPGSSTVEFSLTPDGDGTILRLVHRDLPQSATSTHAEGWDHFLPRLAIVASGGNPGVDPWTQGPPAAQST